MATPQLFQIGIKGLIRNSEGDILMVHIPAWNGNPAHWDLPGGRVDPGEDFVDTLRRELREELGIKYTGTPKQLAALLTTITIPVGEARLPLAYVVYEVELPAAADIRLDPDSDEEAFEWFTPALAAEHMVVKFTPEFCDVVRAL